MFNENYAFPQEINISCSFSDFVYLFFEGGYTSAANTKDIKEIVPKGLGLSVFTAFIEPLLAKKGRPRFYFIPT
jgi:hypothetical protein